MRSCFAARLVATEWATRKAQETVRNKIPRSLASSRDQDGCSSTRGFLGLTLVTLWLHASPVRADIENGRLSAFVGGAVAEAMERDHIDGVSVAVVGRDAALTTKGYGISALNPRAKI